MDSVKIIQMIEAELVDAETLIRVLRAVDELAQSDSELISAYPLIHGILAEKVASAFDALNPAILRS